jgi:hypothetical protein
MTDSGEIAARVNQSAEDYRSRRPTARGRAPSLDGRPVRPTRDPEPPPPSPPPIDPESGPGHYAEASRYAREAATALSRGQTAEAQVLAAIGQVHATPATAAATAEQDPKDGAQLARDHPAGRAPSRGR